MRSSSPSPLVVPAPSSRCRRHRRNTYSYEDLHVTTGTRCRGTSRFTAFSQRRIASTVSGPSCKVWVSSVSFLSLFLSLSHFLLYSVSLLYSSVSLFLRFVAASLFPVPRWQFLASLVKLFFFLFFFSSGRLDLVTTTSTDRLLNPNFFITAEKLESLLQKPPAQYDYVGSSFHRYNSRAALTLGVKNVYILYKTLIFSSQLHSFIS